MEQEKEQKSYLPITAAAIKLGCSPEAIYRMIRLGRVKSVGRNPKMVVADEVERVLARS